MQVVYVCTYVHLPLCTYVFGSYLVNLVAILHYIIGHMTISLSHDLQTACYIKN